MRLVPILISCLLTAACDVQTSKIVESGPGNEELANVFMHYTIRYYCENDLLPERQENYLQVIQPEDQTPELLGSLKQWLSVVSMSASEPGKLEVINSNTGSVSRASCSDFEVTSS